MIFIMIKIVALTVSWVLGWKIITAENMPLEWLYDWGQKKVDEGHKIFDGLIVCEWCLPNLHGLLFVWPLSFVLGIVPFEWNYKYLVAHPFCVGASSFICGFLWNLYTTMNAKKEYYTSMNEANFDYEEQAKK